MQTMVTRIRFFVLLVGVVAGSCGWPLRAFAATTVIVISLDGTRPADLHEARLPALDDLATRGARADRLVPVFPSNTFPNHVSLVTGVSPPVHGIVNNVFLDPQRGLFRYLNDPSWVEVEPIWSIASRHGIVSAAYHWIGSEGPWRTGHGPAHWKEFDADTGEDEKVDQILDWLDIADPEQRPRLITSWFRGADRAAHRSGPGSPEARRTLRSQDRALARLVAGLEERRAFENTVLLVVSDHGMAPVAQVVDLRAAMRASGLDVSVLGGGGVATISTGGRAAVAARAAEQVRALGLDALRPGVDSDDPRLRNSRFGDLVVLAPLGTAVSGRPGPPMRGAHGYPPDEPSMGALLIAAGRGIPSGSELGEVRNLDVAPTVLAWLGIGAPPWMEGRPIADLVGAVPGTDPSGEDG
jgi:hypothetical protein